MGTIRTAFPAMALAALAAGVASAQPIPLPKADVSKDHGTVEADVGIGSIGDLSLSGINLGGMYGFTDQYAGAVMFSYLTGNSFFGDDVKNLKFGGYFVVEAVPIAQEKAASGLSLFGGIGVRTLDVGPASNTGAFFELGVQGRVSLSNRVFLEPFFSGVHTFWNGDVTEVNFGIKGIYRVTRTWNLNATMAFDSANIFLLLVGVSKDL